MSTSAETTKHTLLRQMGVDVWLPRRAATEPLAELSAAVEAAERAPAPAESPAAEAPAAEAPAARKPASEAPTRSQAAPGARPGAAEPAGPTVAAFSVACLSKGSVLMLVALGQAKTERRFALDVLAAASGVFGGETAQLAFDWPQPGVENNPDTARRALAAFVAKQLGDRPDGQVLIGAEVVERLEAAPDGCLVLPAMAELMVDGERKRALWQALTASR